MLYEGEGDNRMECKKAVRMDRMKRLKKKKDNAIISSNDYYLIQD